MIYELTTDYLHQKFPKTDEQIDFSHQGKELAQHLNSQGHKGSLAEYKEEVRDAIKDFFSSVGRASVFFKGKDTIKVKVLPKVDEAALKEELKALVIENDESRFVQKVVKKICENSLNFAEINNRTWEATYLSHVKSGFFQEVYKKGKNRQDLATEISLDIIRENFAFLNDTLAEVLLEKMLTSKKAEAFLEYYGKTMIGDGGVRFKTPDIIDRQGRIWHLSTIRSVALKYHKEKVKADNIKEQIHTLTHKTHQLQQELLKLKETKKSIEDKKVDAIITYSENGSQISTLRKELGELRKTLESTKDSNQKTLLEKKITQKVTEIEERKLQDNHLKMKKIKAEKLVQEHIDKESKIEKKIQGIQIQIQTEKTALESYYKQFSGTKEAYEYIVDAVANALMRKKRVLG